MWAVAHSFVDSARHTWADPAHRIPTLADLDALPAHIKGEIIDGVLYTMTRPRGRHQNTALAIGGDLRPPFGRGRRGPGGWWILPEPGIELPNTPEIAPDIAGWRRERLPVIPEDTAITVVYSDEHEARTEPFGEVALDVAGWWL